MLALLNRSSNLDLEVGMSAETSRSDDDENIQINPIDFHRRQNIIFIFRSYTTTTTSLVVKILVDLQ